MEDKFFLIVSAVFPPEPVVSAKLSFDLATSLSEKGVPVTVISPRPTRPQGFAFESTGHAGNFKHICLESFTCPQSSLTGRLKETYSFGQASYNFIKDNHTRIRAIYSNTWPLFAQYYTVKAAKKYKIPVIIHVQDIYPESLSNKLPFGKSILNALLMPFDRYIFKHANKIIAISDKMRTYLANSRKVDLAKIAVVQNWQDESEFIAYTTKEESVVDHQQPFTFMYLGNIGPVAGIDVIIEAFAAANLSNSRLVIAGSGSTKESLEKKATLYKSKQIEFWPVPDGHVQKVQSKAQVMLLPMKKGAASSSIPSKLPAYMFSKKPVLACVDNDSDIADVIIKGKCGWVIEPENTRLLAQKMEEIIQIDRNRLQSLGNSAFDYAIEHFSKKENLKKLLSVIVNN